MTTDPETTLPPTEPPKKRIRFQIMKGDYLNPALLQLFGLFLLFIFAVYYFLAHQVNALLIGASLTLIGLGSAGGALVTVRQEVRETGEQHQEQLRRISDEGEIVKESGENE